MRTLVSDDLTVFIFRVIFSLKNKKYPIFAFAQSLFSIKMSPKIVNLALTEEKLCLNF